MSIEQLNNPLTFYAFFTFSKQGVTGLTVTVDVYRVNTSATATQVVTGASATEVGGGLYLYQLSSGTVTVEGEYVALFKTADTTVDVRHIPAIWAVQKAGTEYLDAQVTSRAAIADYTTARAVKLDNLDAAVTSRLASGNVTVGSYAAGQDPATLVWAAGTRTLTAFGFSVIVGTNNDKTGYALAVTPPTVANIWDAATSGLTTVGSVGKRIADYVDAAVSSRLATSGYTAPDNTSIGTILSRTDVATSTRASGADYTTARAANLDNLDAAVSTRLPTSSYTAPSSITSLQADVTTILGRVDVAVSTRLGTGGGSTSYAVTVTRPDGTTPISGASVWVTTDSAGGNVIAGTLTTNGSGVATFMLDAGSYYLWRQAEGWNFANPTAITVS